MPLLDHSCAVICIRTWCEVLSSTASKCSIPTREVAGLGTGREGKGEGAGEGNLMDLEVEKGPPWPESDMLTSKDMASTAHSVNMLDGTGLVELPVGRVNSMVPFERMGAR